MRILLLLLILLAGCTAQPPGATLAPTEALPPTPRDTLTPQPTDTPRATLTPTPTQTPTLVPSHTATQAPPSPTPVCPGAPPAFLQVGYLAMVSQDPPLASRLRAEPGLDGKLVGQADAGQLMEVVDGPRCADGYVWWQVRLQGQNLVGWTVEGDAEGPWLVTPTPVPTASATPIPGQCPPFPVLSSLPNPTNAADAPSYLGKIFNSLAMPPELQFQRSTVVDLEKGYAVTQLLVRSSGQVLLWLEKPLCRDTEGRAFSAVVDAWVLPPLTPNQYLAVSSIDRCELNGENAPRLAVLGELEAGQAGDHLLKNLKQAWRVNMETDRLEPIEVRGLACTVYTGGP